MIRRVAKRGFTSKFRKIYQIVNLENLSKLKASVITPQVMWEKNLVASRNVLIKILGHGEISSAKNVQAHAFSKSAEEKIKKAGGTTEVINAIRAR